MHSSNACLVILASFCNFLVVSSETAYLSDILRWNYTSFNPNCATPGGRNPCKDVRICRFAVASHMLGGWPAYCGTVAENVPKVCCGLPLVLGKALMNRVEEEKARKRECGKRSMSVGLSPTENQFFEYLRRVPQISTSDLSRFDPPLDQKMEIMMSSMTATPGWSQQDFPWMVAIFNGSELLCGGALIDRVHVLSAAHCFQKDRSQTSSPNYIVRIGSISLDWGVPFGVKTLKVHEDYDARKPENDIAILTLDREILSSRIPHICLPNSENELGTSGYIRGLRQKATLMFWEKSKSGPTIWKILENLPVISNVECERDYRRINCTLIPHIGSKFICTKQEMQENSMCTPYQSGPLMYKYSNPDLPLYYSDSPWILVGLLSFGPLCGQYSYPAVYTRISEYVEWIGRNTS